MIKANPLIPLFIIFSVLTLSGCQSFSNWFPEQPAPVIVPYEPSTSAPVVHHEFQLAEGQTLIGQLATINTFANDTLSDFARHFGLGYNDMVIANPDVSPWTPKPESRVVLPMQFILPDGPHTGIVLNLATMRMFFYPKKTNSVFTYPVGIGREGWNTPQGLTQIADKIANPSWHVPPSIQQEHEQKGDKLPTLVRSGPDNPLGLYAMHLAIPNYLIHGTNKPYGIGMQISHGCVQMYPEDIEVLFKKAAVGMPVRIVHQPYLVAWHENMLYLEAHEPLEKWASAKPKLQKQLLKQLRTLSTKKQVEVDWDKVERILKRGDGIPTPVLVQSPDITEIIDNAPLFSRPEKLYGQPIIAELQEKDWSILVATFNDALQAQELVAMLNHQGPIIPARKVQKENNYQVIAGPFKNKQEVIAAAKRLRMDFEMKVKAIKPVVLSSK
ncbi:MAG: L,D-transpeptidase family protein [Methylococcales bacterium]